jgi:4-hydroxy-tetrahydrodipicolinate synthase
VIPPALVTAPPTAFAPDGSLDIASTARIFGHAIAGGVDALLVNGTTGEFAALSREERRSTLAAALNEAGSERVIAHVGAASPFETGLLTEDALGLGSTRLSVLTPFYMPASVDGIQAQISAVREVAGDAELFLYLFPDRTGVHITPDEAASLIEENDLAGVKISIAGTDYLRQVVNALSTPRAVLSGNDGLLREVLAAGGTGIVSGVSSSMPAPFARLVEAIRGNSNEVGEVAEIVNGIVPILGPSISGLKISLQRQGVIDSARCRMAIDTPDSHLIARIDTLLTEIVPELSASGR